MKIVFALGAMFAAALALPALAGTSTGDATSAPHHVRHHAHHGAASTPVASIPATATAQVAPAAPSLIYPEKQGDADGLSRNPSDCNKGCIDGPY